MNCNQLLTLNKHSVILYVNKNRNEIEVAFFISTMLDVSGTDEDIGKEKMPKGYDAWDHTAWAQREQCCDCHRKMECYLNYT